MKFAACEPTTVVFHNWKMNKCTGVVGRAEWKQATAYDGFPRCLLLSDFNLAFLRIANKCQNWKEQGTSRVLELLPP